MTVEAERNRRYNAAIDAVEKIQAGLNLSLGGPMSITIDGQTTNFNHEQALRALEWNEKRIDRYHPDRGNSRTSSIRLDNSI